MQETPSAAGPITAELRMNAKIYRDLSRASRPEIRVPFARRLVWALLICGVVFGAAYSAAHWLSLQSEWRYVGPPGGALQELFSGADAFRPVLVILGLGVFSGAIMMRVVFGLSTRHWRQAARKSAGAFDGAKVLMDPSGVSVSGADFGSRWGWGRIERIHRGRAALILVVGNAGLTLPYASLSAPKDEAIRQLNAWRDAAWDGALRAE